MNKPGLGDALRFCVNVYGENALTCKVARSMPNNKEIIENLGGSKYYIKFDFC